MLIVSEADIFLRYVMLYFKYILYKMSIKYIIYAMIILCMSCMFRVATRILALTAVLVHLTKCPFQPINLHSTDESALMREFFGINSSSRSKDSVLGSASVDGLSCISSSSIGTGSVKNSLLSNVKCNHIDAEGCILINVTANSIIARHGCIIYNIADGTRDGVTISAGQVLAGVFKKDGTHTRINSSISTDGGSYSRLLIYFDTFYSLRQIPSFK